jgi:hypothetical protein
MGAHQEPERGDPVPTELNADGTVRTELPTDRRRRRARQPKNPIGALLHAELLVAPRLRLTSPSLTWGHARAHRRIDQREMARPS